MLGKQVLIAISLLVVSCAGQGNILKILMSTSVGNCGKVLQEPNGPLQLTHVRVLTTDGSKQGVITKNVICTRDNPIDGYLKFKCSDRIEKPNEHTVLMIGVTATKKTMASQIEYRYKETTMGMFKEGITVPETVATQKFEDKAHISIKEIIFSDDYKVENEATCITEKSYPDNLIADHGLYVSNSLSAGKHSDPITWTRIYFDPDGLGERLIKE